MFSPHVSAADLPDRVAVGISRGEPAPSEGELSSAQAALDTVRKALPGMLVTNVFFPNSEVGSPYH